MQGIDLDKAEKLINLKTLKTRLTKELKGVSADLAEVEKELLEEFALSPLTKITLMGKTLSVSRQLWAGLDKQFPDEDTGEAYNRACDVLVEMGLEEFVGPRFMPQTLSGYVRELDRDGLPVPEQWEGAIKVVEKFGISVRSSG